MIQQSELKPWCAHEQGIAFITTITLIAAISILVISLMKDVFLYSKSSKQLAVRNEQFYLLEYVANAIAGQIPNLKSKCIIKDATPNNALDQLNTKGCQFQIKDYSFHYLLSDLGEYPCLQLNDHGMMVSSHHWLLTITQDKTMHLQLRLAYPTISNQCESHEAKMIVQGKQSWRLLFSSSARAGSS